MNVATPLLSVNAECSSDGEGYNSVDEFFFCRPGTGNDKLIGWDLEGHTLPDSFTVVASLILTEIAATAATFYMRVNDELQMVGLDGSGSILFTTGGGALPQLFCCRELFKPTTLNINLPCK